MPGRLSHELSSRIKAIKAQTSSCFQMQIAALLRDTSVAEKKV